MPAAPPLPLETRVYLLEQALLDHRRFLLEVSQAIQGLLSTAQLAQLTQDKLIKLVGAKHLAPMAPAPAPTDPALV